MGAFSFSVGGQVFRNVSGILGLPADEVHHKNPEPSEPFFPGATRGTGTAGPPLVNRNRNRNGAFLPGCVNSSPPLPEESFRAIFNFKRLFQVFGLFEITSENALQNKGKLAISRVIFRFSGYFSLWRLSPKI